MESGNADILNAIDRMRREMKEDLNVFKKEIMRELHDRDTKYDDQKERVDEIEREIIIFKASLRGMKWLVGAIIGVLAWLTMNFERLIGFFSSK